MEEELVIPIKGSSDYLCPKCGAWICGQYIDKKYIEDEGREFEFNYCHKCGSKFDWHTIR